MATALDERILDVIATKLGTISVAGGYETTPKGVHRPPKDVFDLSVSDCPALIVRKRRRASVSGLRRSEEIEIEVEVLCLVDGAVADVHEAVTDLISDVKKLADSNRRWNDGVENLALWTRLEEERVHETDVIEEIATGMVKLIVGARADLAAPGSTKAI